MTARDYGALCARCGRPMTRAGAALACEPCGRRLDFGDADARFEKRRLLGRGAFGSVYLAFDRRLNREVAIKHLNVQDPEDVTRFQREARLNATLSHPGIVAVHDIGEDADGPFIVMDYIPGRAASELSPSPREAAEWVRQAAEAIQHAHKHGVIHRDLKPANVLVHDGRAYVGDFGLAKRTGVQSSLSLTGNVIGTPAYMPPEQAQGRLAEIGPAADVYALGSTLYALLCGRPPFEGNDVFEIIAQVVGSEPTPPPVDPALSHVVLKCLEKEPMRRYTSAQEVADDLRRWLGGEAVRARPPSVLYRWRTRIRRNRLAWSLGAGLAAAALAAASYLVVQHERARGALDEGLALRDEGRFQEAAAAIERSAALWSFPETEAAGREVRAELRVIEMGLWANRLGMMYDEVALTLKDEIEASEAAAMGIALPDSVVAKIVAAADGKLSSLPEPWRRTSLPHAYRALIASNVGDEQAAARHLDLAIAAGGLDKGDPYGLLFRARLLARAYYSRLEPSFTVGSETNFLETLESPDGPPPSEIGRAAGEIRAWKGVQHLREAAHYVRFLEGLTAMLEGRAAEAAERLEPLDRNREIGMEALFFAGMARFMTGDLDAAIADFTQICVTRTDWIKPRTWLGIGLLIRAGLREPHDPSEAEALFDRAVEVLSDAAAASRRDPFPPRDLGNALYRRAQFHAHSGRDPRADLAAAAAAYQAALEIDPQFGSAWSGIGLTRQETAEWVQREGGDPIPDFESAIEAYDRAVQSGDNPVAALNNRALARLRMASAMEDRGSDADPVLLAAVADLDAALATGPVPGDVTFNLAMALAMRATACVRRGEPSIELFEASLSRFDEALRMSVPAAKVHSNRARVFLGFANARMREGLDMREQERLAIEAIDLALEAGDRDADLCRLKGDIHMRNGRYRDAANAYEAGLKLEPGSERLRQRLEDARSRSEDF